MLLLAEGHSYKQIRELTGFSYTKVNRCLTEGRRSFLQRVEGIESGAECERLAPLLSAMADGEATRARHGALRPHLRTCLSCRAALRDAREVPARVAALAPVGLLAAGAGGGAPFAGGGASRAAWASRTPVLTGRTRAGCGPGCDRPGTARTTGSPHWRSAATTWSRRRARTSWRRLPRRRRLSVAGGSQRWR